jgi:hypothetical protein
MSRLTGTDAYSLMEAYQAVYDSNLREQLEEEREVELVGIQIIENAAYVLFSQGYDVDDVISYFTEAENNTIVEDFVNFAEGNLIIESVAVSDEYIEEQFQQLDERLGGILSGAAKLVGKGATALGKSVTGLGNKATVVGRAQNIKNIRADKLAKWKQGSLATPMGPAAKPAGFLQKAGNFAKGVMTTAKNVAKKIPGAGLVSKVAKGPIGKVVGRAAPGVGAALYGMDAVDRAKKGDWGGAALSGVGAVASAVPGVGTLASLAPAGVQMATDAMGLTGDRSKRGPSTKTSPAGPPSLKGKQNYASSKGKYYSSSDQKTYGNYNDALAARRSRRGETAPSTPTTKATPSTPSPAAAAATPEVKATNTLAAKSTQPEVKPSTSPQLSPGGRKGNSDLAGKTFATGKTKGGTSYEVRTPTSAEMSASKSAGGGEEGVKAAAERSSNLMGGPEGPGKINSKQVNSALKAEKEREKNRVPRTTTPQTVSSSYEYDAFDIILEYLLENGHADTVTEAAYIMTEMDAETIVDIVETIAVGGIMGGGVKAPVRKPVVVGIKKPVSAPPRNEPLWDGPETPIRKPQPQRTPQAPPRNEPLW